MSGLLQAPVTEPSRCSTSIGALSVSLTLSFSSAIYYCCISAICSSTSFSCPSLHFYHLPSFSSPSSSLLSPSSLPPFSLLCTSLYFLPSSLLSLQLWDLASGRLKLTLTGHISSVRALTVSPRQPYLFSAGEDKQVKCWDLEYNKVSNKMAGCCMIFTKMPELTPGLYLKSDMVSHVHVHVYVQIQS